jgi:hypothetical protein
VLEAVDGSEISPPSAEFQVMPDIAAPGKVIVLPGDQHADLIISEVSGAVGYTVEAFSGSQSLGSVETTANRAALSGLPNGEVVRVRVTTIGTGGKGTRSIEAAVIPKAEDVRFADDYGNPDTMSDYRQDVSAWRIANGLLQHESGGDHQGEIGVRNLRVIDGTITAVAVHATAGADWGIAFRGSSPSTGYLFGFENGLLVIRRDGANLATPVPFTAKLGESYKLEVSLNGKQIRALLDGEVIFDLSDTVYTGGRVGLHSWADANFAYLELALEETNLLSTPEIYQVKEGDGQVALQYSEVDGAVSYAILYRALNESVADWTEVAAAPGSAVVMGLDNDARYAFKIAAVRASGTAESAPVEATPTGAAGSVLYYVDAGDGSVRQLEDGESLGTLQSLEEQPYGPDALTGASWGYEADDGSTWAHTAPTDAYESIRQYDGNANGKGLAYRFELPNGAYKVTVGFFDPWQAGDRSMELTINGETMLSNYVIGSKREAQSFDNIDVTNGELSVKVVKAGGSKPMVSWIKIEKQG